MEQAASTVIGFFTFLISLLVGGILLIAGLFILKKIIDRILFTNALSRDNTLQFLRIKIPSSNEEKEIAMEEFLRSIHRLLSNNTQLSLELISSDQFTRFYIGVPAFHKSVVESQLYAQYPEAEIEAAEDYLPSNTLPMAVAQLKFKRHSMFSLKTHKESEEDFLKNLTAILSKTEKDEKIFIQFALKRIGSKFWERGWKAFQFRISGRKYDLEGNAYPAQAKLSQDLYLGKLRVAYVAPQKSVAQAKLNALIGVFKSIKGDRNEIKKNRFFVGNIQKAFEKRIFEKGDLWSPPELATLYHFPYKGSIVSNVVNTISKRAPAPDILPLEGTVDPKEVSFIGETNYRNEKKIFGIKRFDRRRHVYLVGKTGSGKSRLLELLLIADIQQGHGCCLIDPHGDLADELLMFVPKERIKDVVYINPIDRDFPIGFNPLEPVTSYEERQHLSRFFIAIFKKLFAGEWNPRMEHLIRYITLALLETPDSNVLGIPRILSDTKYRQRVIKQIQDPVVKSFWTNEFSASNEQFLNVAGIPILNKVGQFISNPIVRNLVGQRKNMLNFEKFMNNGNIVIINLSKGKLGEENAALLGSMFITKLQQAALARARISEEERRDFYFYVDEFQNFATDAFSSILSEARKYRLDLTIAHQYIAQLPEDVKATAFGNVGTIITFAIGGDDAAYLAKEYAPVFTPDDMINLNTREMYIKMSVDGKVTPPFSARTIDVPRPPHDYSIEIVDHSRLTYGRPRVTVENEIAKWTSVSESIESGESDEGFPEPIF